MRLLLSAAVDRSGRCGGWWQLSVRLTAIGCGQCGRGSGGSNSGDRDTAAAAAAANAAHPCYHLCLLLCCAGMWLRGCGGCWLVACSGVLLCYPVVLQSLLGRHARFGFPSEAAKQDQRNTRVSNQKTVHSLVLMAACQRMRVRCVVCLFTLNTF